ncbi:hypothetical protein EDC01DRAFT_785286 [Geopyxis carbonaria]|nr:hypothetical protein EDC01DRAFT_785286 [Geopyxis carbonaria]
MPPNPLSKEEIDPDYLTEVFQLVAAEAHRQGTDWMWMDSLCVDQHDPADKAVQIPRMRDYYANALCCVVVSESIRRRVAPIAPVPAKVSDNADIVGDGMDFPPHLLECWTVGFHDERVWTLQETLLAKEVVCRGANVRIDATRLLDPSVRENYRMNTTGAILNAFPTMGALLGEGVEVTPQYCLRLCRNRGSKFLHDHVYGMLGLFPEKIRKSLPVDYETLTPSAVLAIFSYLRVKEGDLSALLTLWDRKTFPNQKCTTPLGPSWILVGFGYAQTEIRAFVPHEDVNAQVDDTEGAGYALHATMAYTQVTSIESRATVDPDDWTMNADLMDDANYAVEIEDSAMTYGATVEVDGDHVKNIDVKKIVAAAVGKDPRTLDNGESENVWVWLLLAETEDNGWTRLGIMFTDELNPPEKKRFRIT